MPVNLKGAPSALALLIPHTATAGDVDAVATAIASYAGVRSSRDGFNPVAGVPWAVTGHRFWRELPLGMLRLWRTSPPAVPDSRGLRERRWTFAHAALLSLGYVWKDRLPNTGRREEQQIRLVDAMQNLGVAVLQALPLRESNVRPYVHKVNEHAVVRPYRAELWLGDLCPDRAVLAIGQSRHLGGGLLVPHDVADEARSR